MALINNLFYNTKERVLNNVDVHSVDVHIDFILPDNS